MNDLFEGFEGVKPVEAASDPFAGFEGVKPVEAAPAAGDPVSAFRAKLADPKEYARIKRWADYLGMTPEDPIVQQRLTNPLNFSTYSTLNQLKTTGNLDEVNDMTPEGNAAGTGLRAALTQFGHAGGIFRRRNDALVSRIAAGQEMEVGDTRDPTAQLATGMAGAPRPNLRTFKKLEDMTRAEQDATVPKEIVDLVNQYDTPEAPLDARTRAEAIYAAAKSSATAREQTMEMAAEELALREELTGKSDGFLNSAGILAAKGMPTVGYGNTFLVGGALAGGLGTAAGLAAGGVKLAATIGSGVLGGLVAGADKTSELLTADINPDTGEVDKQGTDYDDARLRGYAYGAFESSTEILTGKVLGVAFKWLDKVTGGYAGKAVSKGMDHAAQQMAKTSIGRGVAELAKGIQRIAGLQALENPLTEGLEEGIQQWGDTVFAQRPSDTETPVYAKNVFNEATGEMEQVEVEPGSDEERTAKRMLARYGDKSGYAEVGTRQMMIGEKTKEFGKEFFTWDNMVALAEGFALQYALTLGTGAMHAVKSKKSRLLVENALMAAGHTNADIIRMSDEKMAEAFDGFYGNEANRDEYAEIFKDAGEMLSQSAQRVIDSELFMRTGDAIKPNFSADVAKETENGAATVDDEKSGLSVDYTSTLEGTAFTVRDRDGVLAPATFNTAEEAQKGAEKMSQIKQGRQLHMEKRAEIATRVAQVFAPGRNVILVQTDKDMKAAATENGSNPAKYVSGAPGLTAPNGALIINVAANTSFDELVKVIKHETGHSVWDEAGLTKLIEGKTLDGIAVEFQKSGIIAPGADGLVEFVKEVRSVQSQSADRGVKLTDAGAVGEVLSMLQERMTPVFRKRFGDGLVTALRGKDKSAENMKDVRRAVAAIMYSGREAKVEPYGGIDAWKAPAPAFEGDPIAMAGAETGEKETVEPAGEAAPEAMPAQGEEAPGAEVVAPDAESAVKPPAAKSPEAEAAAKEIKAAFEQKLKVEAPPVEEGAATPPAEETAGASIPVMITKKMEADLRAGGVSQADIDKMTPQQANDRLAELAKRSASEEKAKTETAPTEKPIEDVPSPQPAPSEAAAITPTPEAGGGAALSDKAPFEVEGLKFNGVQRIEGMEDQQVWTDTTTGGTFYVPGTATAAEVATQRDESRARFVETETPPLNLDGGTPADIAADAAKVEAQRKEQETKDEIAKKAAAPLKGDMGDTTPPLPGMEGVAPDDLELLNQKPKEAQNADQERGAKEVAGGKQARGAEADGGGDAQGSEAAGTAGKPEGEGLQERAVEVAAKNAKAETAQGDQQAPSTPKPAAVDKHPGFVMVASGVTPSDFEEVLRGYVDRRNVAKGGPKGTTIRRQKSVKGDDAWLKYQNIGAGTVIYDNLNLYVPAEDVGTWNDVAIAAGRRELTTPPLTAPIETKPDAKLTLPGIDEAAPKSSSNPPVSGTENADLPEKREKSAPQVAKQTAIQPSNPAQKSGKAPKKEVAPKPRSPVERAIGDSPMGVGKYAGTLVKDLFGKDPAYALWAADNFSGSKRAKEIAGYLRGSPEYVAEGAAQTAALAVLDTAENRDLLKKHGLTMKATGATVTIGGSTYGYKDIIKTAGGRFGVDNVWRIAGGKAAGLLDALRGVPAVVVGPRGKSADYIRNSELSRLRETLDGRPDRGKFDRPAGEYVGEDTQALLRKGVAAGIPADIVTEQIEDVAKIKRVYDANDDRRLFILASEPGSGKTFVLGAAIRELRRSGAKRIVYVTMRSELINQIKGDLAEYGMDGVEFMTYPVMRDAPNIGASDVLIFDEAHSIKNVDSADGARQAKMAKKWIEKARFTILSTATPFENPVQAAYMEPTGVFAAAGGFVKWAKAYGAHTLKIGKGVNAQVVLTWQRTITSDGDAKAARNFFMREGVFTSRPIRLAPGMAEARLSKITADREITDIYNAISRAAENNEDSLQGFAAAWIINFKKRLLEAAKVQRGIEEAKSAIGRGRNPIIFVETKAERMIDIPGLLDRERQWAMAVEEARSQHDRPPPRSAFGLPPVGVTDVLEEFMNETGRAVITIPSAEDVIVEALGKDNVAVFTGSVTPKVAQRNLAEWRAGAKRTIVATMAKGGTGLSLHDKVGDHPTTQIVINLPWTATQVKQVAQRNARYGLKSNAEINWIFADNIPFDRELAAKVGGRMADMGASVYGDAIVEAQQLEDWDFQHATFSEQNAALRASPDVSGEKGAESPVGDAPRFRLPGVKLDAEPVFFSQLRRTLEAKMPNRMTVMALRGLIDPSRSGVKADEIEWTGLREFLDGKNPGDFVTKAEVMEAVKDVEIEEVVKGQTQAELESQEELTALARLGRDRTPEQDARYEQLARRLRIGKDLDNATKFEQYQLPGGENYRELLLTLPEVGTPVVPTSWNVVRRDDGRLLSTQPDEQGAIAMAARMDGVVIPVRNHSAVAVGQKDVFKSPHFDEPNILAHVRFNERQAANGDKTLFLEEVQSDWSAAKRKERLSALEPDSVGKHADNFLAGRVSSVMALNTGDRGVLSLLQNDKIRGVVIERIPVDVVNMIRALESSPEQFLRNPPMESGKASVETLGRIWQGILGTARETLAEARAKLLSGFESGRGNENLLPAVKASDLSTREVVWLLSPKTLYHDPLLGSAGLSDVASGGTKALDRPSDVAGGAFDNLPAPRASEKGGGTLASARAEFSGGGLTGLFEKALPAPLTSYLDWHDRILSQSGASLQAVPVAPFIGKTEAYVKLAFKRMLRWAAENGFARIAWTTGEQQAERYDLSKQVDAITATRVDGNVRVEWLVSGDGRVDEAKKIVSEKELSAFVGKDLSAKILAQPINETANYVGADLKVGGGGMRTFYDQILPSIANDIGKKFGARVEDIGIGDWGMVRNAKGPREYATELFGRDLWTLNEEESRVVTEAWKANQIKGLPSVHSLPVTPAMRESVMQGQPRFKLPGVTLDAEVDAARAQTGTPEFKKEYDAVVIAYKGTDKWLRAPNGKPTKLNERQWVQVRTPSFKAWFGDWEKYANGKDGNGVWVDSDNAVSKVVDDNGEPLVVFHGTTKFGFTEIDPYKADKHRSPMVFASNHYGTARSYSNGGYIEHVKSLEEEVTDEVKQYASDQYGWEWESDEERDALWDGLSETQKFDAIANYRSENGEEDMGRGVYPLFLNIRNPLESDFEGRNWDGASNGLFQVTNEEGEVQYDDSGKGVFTDDEAETFAKALSEKTGDSYKWDEADGGETTNSVAEDALRFKNDGAIIRNVFDDGGRGGSADVADVYVFFKAGQAKSALDNTGEFGSSNDIRFRLPGVTLDAEYMEAVEKGDRGGDNLVELLRKTKKDERDKAVAAWLERNPETAKRLEKMVEDRARAAGYKHGPLWHASAEAFNVFRRRFERDGLKSAAEADKILRFGKGIFFSSDESVARNFGGINRRFFLKIDELYESNLGGVDYYYGKGYDAETGEPWIGDNGEHLGVEKAHLPDEMAEANLDDSGTRNTGVVVRGVYESIPSAGNPKPLADTWVVGNPSQIKSADPVTYDDAGNVIPLSERFNPDTPDIRYRLPGIDTPEFKAWFRDSKVVDSDGKPLVVYHGTAKDFTAFDLRKMEGRSEGPGFYFTNNRAVASGYGWPMDVYLSLQKPMAYDTPAFNKKTLTRIMRTIATLENAGEGGDIRDGYLANFGDTYSKGIEGALREGVELVSADTSALDQISGLVGAGVSAEYVLRAVTDVTGYDGIVAKGFSNEGDESNTIYVAFRPEQIKSATANIGTFDPANADIRYRLPGVSLDDLSAPVRVGELRTQTQLENASDNPGFPILDHIRGGSKIVIPRGNLGKKGEWNWFTEAGGLGAFNLAEQKAFFRHPKPGRPNRGNLDILAKELKFDNAEDFANAFMAEVERSRALYREQKERQARRRSALEAVSEHRMFKGKANIGETMGRAIGSVYREIRGEDKTTLDMIRTYEGDEAARDYILMNHFEKVVMDMDEHYAFIEGKIEPPAIIEDRSLSVEVATGENGETRSVYAQNQETLKILAARLYTSNPEGVAKITDEGAAAFVREALDTGGPEFLREQGEKMVAERLTGQRDTALNKYQTAVMLWYQTDLDARTKEQDGEAEKAASTNNISALNLADMERDNIHRATLDYLNAARQYGSLAGQALQALKLRVDHAFNIVKIYRQAFEDNGDIPLTPQQYAALKARVAALEKKWNDYVEAASLPDSEAELDARVVELEKLLADATTNRDSLKATVGQLETKKTALESEYAKQSATATQLSEQKAQLEAQIAGLENEIAMREALNQEVGALQAKVDALQAKLDALDAEYAGASPELLASLEKRLADLTALYNRKLADYRRAEEDLKAANDRLKRVQKLIAKLGTTAKAKIARRRVVLTEASNLYGAFKTEMEAAQVERMKNRWRGANPAGKALMTVAVTRDMIRALQSMADESVAGRQLAKLGLAHPILWARAWAQSQQLVFSRSWAVAEDGHILTWAERSDRRLFEIDQMMREHPMFDVLVRKGGKLSKLSWMDLTADPSSFDEQQTPVGPLLRSMLPSKFTRGYTSLLEVSNNQYAGMSNMLRFAAACQLYEKMNVAKGKTPTEEDIDAIISTVDIFGGRGDLRSMYAQGFKKFADHFLYSPRLTLSNIQFYKRMMFFAVDPATSGRAKAMIATEYLRLGASYAVISVLFRLVSKMLSDDPDEQRFQFRPGHSAFLTLMRGQRRFDFTGGAAMWARSVSQILGFGDKLDTETGLVTQKGKSFTREYPFIDLGDRQNLDYNAVGRLVRSKMDPWTGMMTDLLAGKTYRGQAAGPLAKANSPDYAWRYPNLVSSIAPVPLGFQSIVDLLRGDTEQGIAPLRNPLFLLEAVGAQIVGTGASSLPVNAELAQEVAEGYTRNAEELETLNNRLQGILSDRKMSPELKELRAQRVQDKIDRLRGL